MRLVLLVCPFFSHGPMWAHRAFFCFCPSWFWHAAAVWAEFFIILFIHPYPNIPTTPMWQFSLCIITETLFPIQHDLQAAISAAQAAVTTGEAVQLYIPTPDASITIKSDDYQSLYKKPFNQPTTFIKYSTTVEDSVGCLYDMDEDDDTWLKAYNQQNSQKISEDQFEQVMWEMESLASETMPFLSVVS